MKTYIFCNYYRDRNPKRTEELLTCIHRNLNLSFVDSIFIYIEHPELTDDITHDKARFKLIDRRLEFGDVLSDARFFEPDSLLIILNCDIFLEDSTAWRNIDSEFFGVGSPKKALVCKRHNIRSDGAVDIEIANWIKGDFCDAWVLRTPLPDDFLQQDFSFCVGGAPQCDNTMMYLMNNFFHVYSWGARYRIFHLDNARMDQRVNGMILSDSTDFRPSSRKAEHLDIPALQPWDFLMMTNTHPLVFDTWGDPRLRKFTYDSFKS